MKTHNRLTAALSAGVALLGALAATLGLFARGDGTYISVTSARGEAYEMAASGVYASSARQLVAEGIGWDIFTLAIAVPVLLIAAIFVARGSFRGLLVTAGMLGYFFYMHLEYAVTWAFGPMFPLFIVIHGSSLVGMVAVAAAIADMGIGERFDGRFPRRAYAGVTIGMAALLTLMWMGRIAEGLGAEVATLHGETTMTVQALDLGLVAPISFVIAVAVVRRSAVGFAAAAAFAVTFVTMSLAIASMMVSASIVTGTLQLPPIVFFGLAGVAGLSVAARIYASAAPIGASQTLTRGARPADLPAG